jgi:hypothetical protein
LISLAALRVLLQKQAWKNNFLQVFQENKICLEKLFLVDKITNIWILDVKIKA